jgi:hypothetical protein
MILMDITRRITTNYESGTKPGMGAANMFTRNALFDRLARPDQGARDRFRPGHWGWRYYLLPMIDMRTDVFAVRGSAA